MKKQTFVTAKNILLAMTFALTLAVPTLTARAQAGGGILDVLDRAKQTQAQQLEGSWALVVTPQLPPGAPPITPFRTYVTLARGGALIGFDRTRPFGSPQHGAWAHLGGNEFAATAIQDTFDALGNFTGTLLVRQKITLTGNDQFVGSASAEIRNAAGVVVMSACAMTRGERIKVELPTAQCLSITPPQ